MLSDLRRIVERANTTDGFDAGLSVDFIAEHGPALLARLEGCEAAVLAEREACVMAVCRWCRLERTGGGYQSVFALGGHYQHCDGPHYRRACDAAAIRSRTPESHPLAKEVTP